MISLIVGFDCEARAFQALAQYRLDAAGARFLAAAVAFAMFAWLLNTWTTFVLGSMVLVFNSWCAAWLLDEVLLLIPAIAIVFVLEHWASGESDSDDGDDGGHDPPEKPSGPRGGARLDQPSPKVAKSNHEYHLPA